MCYGIQTKTEHVHSVDLRKRRQLKTGYILGRRPTQKESLRLLKFYEKFMGIGSSSTTTTTAKTFQPVKNESK